MTSTSAPTGIVTPEAVVLEFETAGAGSRILAESLDLVLQITALFALTLALAGGLGVTGGAGGWVVVALYFVLVFLILIGYPVTMETLWNGRTLGKAAMGLRVVTEEGGPIRFRHAAIRGILGLVEILVFEGLPALLSIILSKKNQRLGDMVAGTIVLRERDAAARSGAAVTFPPPPGMESYVATLDVGTLSARQYGVIRSFLTRVFDLTPEARVSLSVRLANPVAIQLNHTPPPMLSPEIFLACVASAYQHRHGGPVSPWAGGPAGGYAPGGYVGSGQPGYPGGGSHGYPGAASPGYAGYPGAASSGYAGSPGYPGVGQPAYPEAGQAGYPGVAPPGPAPYPYPSPPAASPTHGSAPVPAGPPPGWGAPPPPPSGYGRADAAAFPGDAGYAEPAYGAPAAGPTTAGAGSYGERYRHLGPSPAPPAGAPPPSPAPGPTEGSAEPSAPTQPDQG